MPKSQLALKLVNRILDVMSDISLVIARVMIVIMIVLVVIDVVARYAFNSPLGFASEYVMYLMVGVTLLAANYVLREKGHIRVDIVVRLLPPRVQAWLLVVTDAVSIFAVVILLIQTFNLTAQSFANNTSSVTAMATPLGVVQLMLPIGFGFLLLEFIRVLIISIRSAAYFSRIKQDAEEQAFVEDSL